MKIIIDNVQFAYDTGCKLLKLSGGESPFEELSDIWQDIVPLSFTEIAQLENLEQRRIAINYLGIDRLVKQINPKLISTKTLSKTTTWIDENGEEVNKKFKDTYELYEVSNKLLFGEARGRFGFTNGIDKDGANHYIKCKDTSTDREYLIWVDVVGVFQANGGNRWEFDINKINPIQCIAWTITTTEPIGNIEKIIRQGDCILIKPKDKYILGRSEERHLTEKEYKNLLELES